MEAERHISLTVIWEHRSYLTGLAAAGRFPWMPIQSSVIGASRRRLKRIKLGAQIPQVNRRSILQIRAQLQG